MLAKRIVQLSLIGRDIALILFGCDYGNNLQRYKSSINTPESVKKLQAAKGHYLLLVQLGTLCPDAGWQSCLS